MDNKILLRNEEETNSIIAKTFPWFILGLVIFYIIERMGVFGSKYDEISLVLPFVIISIVLLIPLALYKLNYTNWWIKYINISIAIALSGVLYCLLTGDAVLLFPFPIVISILYFNKHLTLYAFWISTPVFAYLNFWFSKDPLTDPWITKVLTISLFGIVAHRIVNKCIKLLNNLVSAEKQTELYNRISNLLDNSKKVSKQVSKSVNNLLDVTEKARTFNEGILKSASDVVASSKQSLESSSCVSNDIINVMNEMLTINEHVINIKDISSKTNQLMQNSSEKINFTVEHMKKLSEINDESFNAIKRLNRDFADVTAIVENINAISKQTKLLSLNASIEAARSGEYGKGFTVVADEIGKLAEQTNNSTSNITQLIKNIQSSSKDADIVMEKGYNTINKIIEEFSTIDEKYKEIVHSEEQMKLKIDEISDKTTEISSKTDITMNSLKNISNLNKHVLESIENIAGFTESQFDLNNQIYDLVKDVSATSSMLVE